MERQYKDSGIEWIGKIPEDWSLRRLKAQLLEIKDKNYPLKTNKVLSLTIKDGVIPYEEKGDVGNKAKENYEDYKIAYPDTIVLNSMNILIGAVGISQYYGCVSPVYYVFKNNENTDLKYINYIMSSNPFQKYLRKYANGILEIRLRVSADDILKRDVPVPNILLQHHIADYLDKKCGEIDSLIGLQEQMIEKLKAYKQSVITEAVTKGLNPNAKLVPSGIDWIGEIPEGWNLIRLKFLCSIQTGNQDTQDAEKDGLYPFYVRSPQIEHSHKYTFEGEGILMAGDGAGAGRVFHHAYGKYAVHQRVYRMADFRKVNTHYLFYFISSTFCKEMDRGSAQSTVPSVRLPMLTNFRICIPPLSEQRAIASYLDEKCSEIDRLIAIKQQKIEKLKDYKKSVIYEAVTGKTIIES